MTWTKDPFANLNTTLSNLASLLTQVSEQDLRAKTETLERLVAASKHASTLKATAYHSHTSAAETPNE